MTNVVKNRKYLLYTKKKCFFLYDDTQFFEHDLAMLNLSTL